MSLRCALFLPLFFALTSLSVSAQKSAWLRLDGQNVLFPENFDAVYRQTSIQQEPLLKGFYLRLFRVNTLPTAGQRARIAQLGVQFLAYYPENTYLLAIPAGFDLAQLKSLHPFGLLPVDPDWKFARSLREPPYGDWAVHGDLVDIDVQVYPLITPEEGAEFCHRHGWLVRGYGTQNGWLQLRIPLDSLKKAASLPFIAGLALARPPSVPEDEKGRVMNRSNLMDTDYGAGPHWRGDGVTVLLRDDGPVGPHIDFKGRLTNLNPIPSPWDINHSDEVAGALTGAGNLNPTARGSATGVRLLNLQYAADFQDATLDLHLNNQVTLTNSSYADGCNDGYTLSAQTVDQQLYQHPTLLHVFSAGNTGNSNCNYGAGSGWGTITGGHKMSKNSVSVANLMPDQSLAASSSRGPATDGRIKPELAALGTNVLLTQPGNSYQTGSGTSFSTPVVVGGFAQLSQAFSETFGGGDPPMALLKAAVLNTASDLGNPGPDFLYGWGRMNTAAAWNLLKSGQWLAGSADQGGTNLHSIPVPPGTRQLRVMLYWSDPPAALNAAKALVNDLDLLATTADGISHQPWSPDPTPLVANLSAPAAPRRDSLNNMEQIVLTDPLPGSVALSISGYEIPFGPQDYYLVWEYLSDTVHLTYPIGGEAFIPGQNVPVSWDAYSNANPFTLQYSPDNGASWLPAGSVNGNARTFNWSVPQVVSGAMLLAISNGTTADTSTFPFSIAPVPGNIVLDTVCLDRIRLHWDAINDSLPYSVYLLGSKYMEMTGVADTNFYQIPFSNDGLPQWVAVAAGNGASLLGRRSLAVQWPGGLKNCPQPNDLALRRVLLPDTMAVIGCAAVQKSVSVRLANAGLNTISGALISWQLNDQSPHTEPLPDLQPGNTIDFTFQAPITLTENGMARLRVWSSYGPETVFFNDTLSIQFPVAVQPLTTDFIEQVEAPVFPPTGWTLYNPDQQTTWVQSPEPLTGADGMPDKAMLLDCFDYAAVGAEDGIYLPPLDLSAYTHPALRFDWSHAQYSNNTLEMLRLEAFNACDLTQQPVIVWEKSDPELATAPISTASFSPVSADEWLSDTVDLSAWSGQSVVLRWVATNAYGNNIYLDNIGLFERNMQPPSVSLTLSQDTLCLGETVLLTVSVPGGYTSLTGIISGPAGVDTLEGDGPWAIGLTSSGGYQIRFLVANAFGMDTAQVQIWVHDLPVAAFSTQLNGLELICANASQDADSYTWDFGDGQGSAEVNPVHLYAGASIFTVTLTAHNSCGDSTRSATVSAVSGTLLRVESAAIRVRPNPTSGDFSVTVGPELTEELGLGLLDITGRMIAEKRLSAGGGERELAFQGLNLPAGYYTLSIRSAHFVLVVPILAQP